MREVQQSDRSPGLFKTMVLGLVVLAAYGSLILVAKGHASPWVPLLLGWLGWLLL